MSSNAEKQVVRNEKKPGLVERFFTNLEKLPNTCSLIFILIVFVAALTYIVPAGEFLRQEINGITQVVPGSFGNVSQTPVGFMDIMTAFQVGMIESASIIFFLFIVGGSFAMLRETAAIESAIATILRKNPREGSKKAILIGVLIFFSFLGGFNGNFESVLAFLPLTITLAIALGYDSVVGVSVGLLGIAVGFGIAPVNPFTVGVAQAIAELPILSGLPFRLVVWASATLVTILYVFRYGDKIKKDPTKSLVYGTSFAEYNIKDQMNELFLDKKRKVVLAIFVGFLVFMVYGLLKMGWYVNELAGAFLTMGILVSLVYRTSIDNMGKLFIKGATEMAFAALMVGAARGIMVVLIKGNILDSIINTLSSGLSHFPTVVAAPMMMLVIAFINLFIPSTSGKVFLTMPIIIAIGDIIGITRQTAVLAFQLGDGITNIMVPTLGTIIAAIAMGKISYSKWLRFSGKLAILLALLGTVSLVTAVLINWGPF